MHIRPRATRFVCLTVLLCLLDAGASALAAEKPGVPDKALQKAIDEAVERGAQWLQGKQQADGSIGGIAISGAQHYEIGATALAGLALLAAKDGAHTPATEQVLALCRKQDQARAGAGSRTTYDTGTLLMFLEAFYRPPEKAPHGGRRGAKEPQDPCGFPPDVRDWVRDMAQWLMSAQETDGGWGYPHPREDMSNTQYALLGLRAAHDCGGTVPLKVFKRVVDRLLAIQEPDGPKVMRTLGGERKGERVYKISAGDKARGWSYLVNPFQPTGSMTTAAISSLAICHDALTQPEPIRRIYAIKDENAVRRAIQDGFAWLDVNFAVDHNPGVNAAAWHFYYLYGLERAAVLAGRVLIGEHDWYLEGARYLLGRQQGDGRWATGALGGREYAASDVLDTAWAILFLKKATRPMDPIPGPVVTETGPPSK